MKRWIRGGMGMAAALLLAFQPGQAFAGSDSVPQQQAAQIEAEGQKKGEGQEAAKAQSDSEKDGNGWEEEFTDTDSRRGTLSVRCDVFQGFHGTVELQIRNRAGGWKRKVELREEGGYGVNLSLPVGACLIEGLKAETDGRRFGCQAERMEMEVEEGKIAICRITVTPDSVYRLPNEENAVDDSQQDTVATRTESGTGSDNNGNRLDEDQGFSSEGIGRETGHRRSVNLSPLWILGLLGAGLCLYGFYYVIKRRNEMGG